jgi:hypothetical protein
LGLKKELCVPHFATMSAAAPGPRFRLMALAALAGLAVPHLALAQPSGMGMGMGMGGPGGDSFRSVPLFVPPAIPRLEAPIVAPDTSRDTRRRAPAAMADYIYDPFYAPLAARAANDDLSAKQQQRLDAYLASKLSQQNELRNKLDTLRSADVLTRQRELTAFAAEQTPRLVALEAEAESIREALIKGEFLQEDINWVEFRMWKLGRDSFQSAEIALNAQIQVIIGAAFYQKNLLPAQRRLLREIATDIAELSDKSANEPQVGAANATSDSAPLFSFAPETARLRLPPNLPEPLMAKILAYEKEKSALKQELNDVLKDADDAIFAVFRNRAVKELAERQAARLAALEIMAEDIRRDFAVQPQQPRPPTLPTVAPGLADQIKSMVTEMRSRQSYVNAMLAAVSRVVPIQSVRTTKDDSGKELLNIRLNTRGQTPVRIQAANQIVRDYQQQAARRGEALARKQAAVREAVAAMFRTAPGPDRDREIDQFLEDYEDAMDRQTLWFLYDDYRTAVLQPGLSPEQRRLLYDAGIGELKLYLPSQLRRPAITQVRPAYEQ